MENFTFKKHAGLLTEADKWNAKVQLAESADVYAALRAKVAAAPTFDDLEESTSKKMKKSTLKELIRSTYLQEAEEEKEEEVDIEADAEDAEQEDFDLNLDLDAGSEDATIDADANGQEDMQMDSTTGASIYDSLAAAFQAAQSTGDEKLINQIANVITYYNKNHILKRG